MKAIPKYLQEPLQKGNDYEAMIIMNKTFIEEHPEDRECLVAWQTSFLYSAGHYEECIAFANEVLPSINDKDYYETIQRLIGFAFEKMGKWEDAVKAYKALCKDGEEHPFEYEYLAKAYEKLGNEEMVLHYEQLMAASDNDVELYEKIAIKYEKKKDFEKAISYMTMCGRTISAESAYHWSYVGRLYMFEDNFDEAIFYFKMVNKIDPEYPDAYFLAGRCYQEKNDLYRALDNYYKALERKPDYPEVITNLGAMKLNEEGDVKRAIEFMKMALNKNPSEQLKTTIYVNLVRLHKQISDYDMEEFFLQKTMQTIGFPVPLDDEDESEFYDGDENIGDDVRW